MTEMRHTLDFADTMQRGMAACLCLPLKPYSVGMELELLRQRNPFALKRSLDEIKKLPELERNQALILAADACSQSEAQRNESSRVLNSRFHWFQIGQKIRQFKINSLWEEWNKKIESADMLQEMELFWNYICAGKTGPEYAKPEEDKPTVCIGAPECAILIQYVRSLPEKLLTLHGESELDYPLALARYEYATILESAGKVQLKSDFVETFEDWVAKQEEKVKDGKLKMPPLNQEKATE
jgi:hypothetical protein